MDERFGIFAERLRVRVNREPLQLEKITIISGSVGFKQQDDTWVNRFVTVKVFSNGPTVPDGLGKGSVLDVSGRFVLEKRESGGQVYENWVILADEVNVQGAPANPNTQPNTQPSGGMDDVPF
jgi:hypothetical protein